MEGLQEALISALFTILIALVGFITRAIVKWLQSKEITERLQGKEWIIKWIVQGVEQAYKELDGKEKLLLAKREAIKFFALNNIPVDEDEINRLIEAMYLEMKANLHPDLLDKANDELPRHIGYTQMTLDDLE